MTASKRESRAGRESRIIERPRLIKLLDESEARIILLLAPAGYGKTTLARQWARTLSNTIWVTLTPAHRDVVTLAEDIAAGIEALGGTTTAFIREYLQAQSNPQRAANGVAVKLAGQMNDVGVQWLVIDDCHEIADSVEACSLISTLGTRIACRTLVCSRVRPTWAGSREVIYGEVGELDRDVLAMTDEEAAEVLGARPDLTDLILQARGWPAILSLVAALETTPPPHAAMPDALHRYLAEELFQSAPIDLREKLVGLALLPRIAPDRMASEFGADASQIIDDARRLGFLASGGHAELHPLLREFLLSKLLGQPDAEARVRTAVGDSIESGDWGHAFGLVLRFSLNDLVDPVLTAAFTPLARRGLVGTLSAFASQVRLLPTFPPAVVDLIEAEVAMRDGQPELAIGLASRAHERFDDGHILRSRASALAGQCHFQLASYDEAEAAFSTARSEAVEGLDIGEAIHGLAVTKVFSERDGAEPVVAELAAMRHESPTHLSRYLTTEISRRRFDEGLARPLELDEAIHSLPRIDDPRARTALTYTVSYALALRAEYDEAKSFVGQFLDDARAFDLEFALPYADWTSAMIALGLRRFGEAERALQAVEDASRRSRDERQAVNAQSLRARLLLQTGQPAEALQKVRNDLDLQMFPSWHAEYLGTRALILACLDRFAAARQTAKKAVATSRAAEVRLLAASAVAVCRVRERNGSVSSLIHEGNKLGVWDPIVCALRASPELAETAAQDDAVRPILENLYQRSHDQALARRAGFRTRSTRRPNELLSPREREVLGLIGRGFRNHQISEALFIADSTTKVHVRHILEKLGARTRAEAVARYEMSAATRNPDSS